MNSLLRLLEMKMPALFSFLRCANFNIIVGLDLLFIQQPQRLTESVTRQMTSLQEKLNL
jgi:hypothetical protein